MLKLPIIYDELYTKAQNKEQFTDLKSLILSSENIQWAFYNIKLNINPIIAGIDKLTINNLNSLSIDDIINTIYKLCNINYIPKSVIAKNIIKKNGQSQYIGIPTIWDRLIQQCILQILEPICEAHFCKRNYSYKINCTIANIISNIYNRLQLNKIYNVLEIDINNFYQYINHSKLIKQLWTLGICDKWLLYQLRNILKTSILYNKRIIHPKQGIIQSGLLQPLLLNIALNEFDHWIESQWEENPIINKYTNKTNKNNIPNKGHSYRAMRKTNLKEMYLIRYHDNIRIFIKNKNDIFNIKCAISKWFNKRLKYQLDLSNITDINTKKKYFEFLGFKIKTILKHKKYVVQSHINDYQMINILQQLKKQIIHIQHANKNIYNEINKYNNIILMTHMYYKIATHISNDCSKLDKVIHQVIFNRLQGLKTTGRKLNLFEKKYYGKSKMLRFIQNEPIYPIGYIQHKHPMDYKKNNNINNIYNIILFQLLKQKYYNNNIFYINNRISLFINQHGCCAITNKLFQNINEIHCHHIIPKSLNGTDDYTNLILINKYIHKLIHLKNIAFINKMLNKYNFTNEELCKINNLRKKFGNFEIKNYK